MTVVHTIRLTLLAASLSLFFVPTASIAAPLSVDKLSSSKCKWNNSSQEHWQAGHPRADQVSPNGNGCLIGVPDPEQKFALIRLNGKLIRLVPSMAEGSPPKSFISEDKKTQANVVVTKMFDGCEKSSGDRCCGVLIYGILSVKQGNDTVKKAGVRSCNPTFHIALQDHNRHLPAQICHPMDINEP